MVILSKNKNIAVFKYEDIYVVSMRDCFQMRAGKVGGSEDAGDILGSYKSVERCHEILQQIVNAYKDGLLLFEMPKE